MDFILTIDTEADNQWDHGCDVTVKNIAFIPRFQELCNKYKVKPTYLVTSEVCEDNFAKEIFRSYLSQHIAEVGAHLHAWTTGPFRDEDGFRDNDKGHAFATELPVDLLKEKIKTLTGQIETSFGIHPQSFRSGRYGFNDDVARSLVEHDYLVDSSVSPYTNWASHPGVPGSIGGPDFIDKTTDPYTYDFGNKSLIEIPITILPTHPFLNRYKAFARYYFRNVNYSIALRVLRKFIFKNQPLWLRPSGTMNIGQFEALLDASAAMKLPFVVMMFHSSELMPGGSPNFPDKDAIEKLYVLLEKFFILLQDRDIASVTLTEAAKKL